VRCVVLSALKPAEEGDGIVVRLLNPTDRMHAAVVRVGFAVRSAHAVRLDEEAAPDTVSLDRGVVRFDVPPRAVRSVLLT